MEPAIYHILCDEGHFPVSSRNTRVDDDVDLVVERIRLVRPVVDLTHLSPAEGKRHPFTQRDTLEKGPVRGAHFKNKDVEARIPHFQLVWRDVSGLDLPDECPPFPRSQLARAVAPPL